MITATPSQPRALPTQAGTKRRIALVALAIFAALLSGRSQAADAAMAPRIEYAALELAPARPAPAQGLARGLSASTRTVYGPFRVLANGHAALMDNTEADSPAQFAAMLRDHPAIDTLELIDSPGTHHDIANLQIARSIRSRGMTTLVPANGSVRSGAVELFLAGARRVAHPAAEFAVHSWMDANGRQPHDFARDHPVNRAYIDYYKEMGLSEDQAQRFYDMTNSVSFDSAIWLNTDELARYVPLERAA